MVHVLDAFWEKRNLGVDVVEVTCSEKDDAVEIETVLKKITVPYSVVKVPCGQTNLIQQVQKCGYQYIETSFQVEFKGKEIILPRMYQRFLPYIKIEEASNVLKEKVLNEIKEGMIFETDRIARDPFFGVQKAGRRYYNWATDELNKGAYLAIAFYKDVPVAFGINYHREEEVYDAFLGGTFSEEAHRGLGFLSLYANMKSIEKQGGKVITTRLSSNNSPILRLHMQYGYEIKSMQDIFIKHL